MPSPPMTVSVGWLCEPPVPIGVNAQNLQILVHIAQQAHGVVALVLQPHDIRVESGHYVGAGSLRHRHLLLPEVLVIELGTGSKMSCLLLRRR